jgi:hypothetical protein
MSVPGATIRAWQVILKGCPWLRSARARRLWRPSCWAGGGADPCPRQCNDISQAAAASTAMIAMNRIVVPFPWIAALIASHMPPALPSPGFRWKPVVLAIGNLAAKRLATNCHQVHNRELQSTLVTCNNCSNSRSEKLLPPLASRSRQRKPSLTPPEGELIPGPSATRLA